MTNNFANLDAQNDTACLAQVASNEQPEQPAQPTKRKVNIAKLVLWNMTQPFHKRIAASDLQARVDAAPMRARVLLLREQIAREVEAVLIPMRANEDALMNM